MAAQFFYTQGMIHREFVPAGNTVNSESYLEMLGKLLLKQNLQTKLHFQKKGRRLLIHNNLPAHSVLRMKCLVVKTT
jgi:hypothetical protein